MDRGDDKHHADDPEKHQLHWQPAEPASGTGNKKQEEELRKRNTALQVNWQQVKEHSWASVQISPQKLQTWTVTVSVTSWVFEWQWGQNGLIRECSTLTVCDFLFHVLKYVIIETKTSGTQK